MNDPLQNEVTVYLQKDIFYVCPNVFCLDIPSIPLFQKLHFPIEIILVFGGILWTCMQSIQRLGLEYVLYQANSLQGWGREGMLRIKAHISSLKEKHSYLFVWKLPPQGLCLSSNVSW